MKIYEIATNLESNNPYQFMSIYVVKTHLIHSGSVSFVTHCNSLTPSLSLKRRPDWYLL